MLRITLSVLIGIASASTFCAEAPQEAKLPVWLEDLGKHVTDATPNQRLLASIGLSAGTIAAALGAMGVSNEQYKLGLLEKLGQQGAYALMIPGMFLVLCSGSFLFKSAKGWYSKIHSFGNSSFIVSGAIGLVCGIDSIVKHNGKDAVLVGALSVVLTALGISWNLQSDPEPEVITEQN